MDIFLLLHRRLSGMTAQSMLSTWMRRSIAQLKSEMAERKLANIEASVVDITKKLPLADESISLAFMSNVLHGLVENDEADSTLKEIARVTAQNGRMAVVEFKKQDSPTGPPLTIRLSPDDVEALARVMDSQRIASRK